VGTARSLSIIGYFNPPQGGAEFAECEATNAMYRLVYGYGYDHEADDEDEGK
jgi:hypothetical protein